MSYIPLTQLTRLSLDEEEQKDRVWRSRLRDICRLDKGPYYFCETNYATDESLWVPYTEAEAKAKLLREGLLDYLSNFDKKQAAIVNAHLKEFLAYVSANNKVDYAGPLAGRFQGLREFNGTKILVTRNPKLITPQRGDCSGLKEIFQRMFGADQIHYFCRLDKGPYYFCETNYATDESLWVPYTEAEAKAKLLREGLLDYLSNFDKKQAAIVNAHLKEFLAYVYANNKVDYAGPLAGRFQGLREFNGTKILVTRNPKLITPQRGDCSGLKEIFQRMFGADQIHYFCRLDKGPYYFCETNYATDESLWVPYTEAEAKAKLLREGLLDYLSNFDKKQA